MTMHKYILVFCLLLCTTFMSAQTLLGISTRWSDEFREWDVFTTLGDQTIYEEGDEEFIEVEPSGELLMRWQADLNWAEWDFNVDDIKGSMRQLWKDDPTQWELLSLIHI